MKTNNSNKKLVTVETSQKNKVNIDVLRRRIFETKKRKQIQNRIMFISALVSVGVISYLAG